MVVLTEWGYRLIETIAHMTIGALLTYLWMDRRLDRSVTAVRRYADTLLTKQRQRSDRAFDQLASDYNNVMRDLRHAVTVCECFVTERVGLTDNIGQLRAENDALRHRLAMNTWGPKTERGRA